MITKDNLSEVLNSLNSEEIQNAINGDGDYISLTLSIGNSGYCVYISSEEYSEEVEEEVISNGGLYCDKSDFIRLLSEVDIEY